MDLIRMYGNDASVLITADQSREAEEIARKIHGLTPVPRGRFKMIDCSLPDQVLEELLFDRLAVGSSSPCTLFLREVGRLGQAQQRRLLQSLVDATVASWPARAPARIVASTTESLFDRVVLGSFDDRLFYRLNVIHLNLRGV